MSVLILGLDGATWKNLEGWISEGELPNLNSLIESGRKGTLNSTIPSTTVPAVPALTTGVDPTELGMFGFTRPDGSVVNSTDIEYPTIWDGLDDSQRALIANLRSTYPPHELNGTMISGDLFLPADADDFVYPPSQYEKVSDFHSSEQIARWEELAEEPEANRSELLDLARDQVEKKYEYFKHLWFEGGYEFGLFWIGKTDAIQHHFWHDQDTILEYYRYVDQLIGDVRKEIGPDNIIILSDHGFGQVPERRFHVNTWLRQEGFLQTKGGRLAYPLVGGGQELLTRFLPKDLLRRGHDLVTSTPEAGEETDDSTEGRILKSDFEDIPGVDFEGSSAHLSFPWGISVSDSELVDDVIESLRGLQDEQGRDVIQEAWRREEVFDGENVGEVPEVVFLTTSKYRAVPQLSLSLFTRRASERAIEGQPVTGEHNSMREGILVLDGPAFGEVDELTMDITEVAPTVTHLLGNPVPTSMGGDVRQDLLSEPGTVRTRDWEHVDRTKDQDRTSDEEAEIRDRLETLGYLEE